MESLSDVGRFVFCRAIEIESAHAVGINGAEQPVAGAIGKLTTKLHLVVGNAGDRVLTTFGGCVILLHWLMKAPSGAVFVCSTP